MDAMDGKELDGRTLQVRAALPPKHTPSVLTAAPTTDSRQVHASGVHAIAGRNYQVSSWVYVPVVRGVTLAANR